MAVRLSPHRYTILIPPPHPNDGTEAPSAPSLSRFLLTRSKRLASGSERSARRVGGEAVDFDWESEGLLRIHASGAIAIMWNSRKRLHHIRAEYKLMTTGVTKAIKAAKKAEVAQQKAAKKEAKAAAKTAGVKWVPAPEPAPLPEEMDPALHDDEGDIAQLGVLPEPSLFKPGSVILSYNHLKMVHLWQMEQKLEERMFDDIGDMLGEFPIWNEFLCNIRGIGRAMGGLIISEINIHKSKYPSSLWKLAGVDVVKYHHYEGLGPKGKYLGVPYWDEEKVSKLRANGHTGEVVWSGRSRRAEHLVLRKYLDKNQEEQARLSITFNPRLKTKLTGVLFGCFLKSGNTKYREIYDNYKHRISNMERHVAKTPKHRNNMAV